MRRHELKAWLLGADEHPIPTRTIRGFLDLDPDAIPHASRRSLRFVLAVLRDIYVDELEVWLWFVRPRHELGDARPADLLLAGRIVELEALAVHQWNLQSTGSERFGVAIGAATLAETSVPVSFEAPEEMPNHVRTRQHSRRRLIAQQPGAKIDTEGIVPR
jgi:hypothetical protein